MCVYVHIWCADDGLITWGNLVTSNGNVISAVVCG